MQDSIEIAIIDNGINEEVLRNPLKNRITVNDKGICRDDFKIIDEKSFEHGTTCAMIIEKFCRTCSLSSIRILDDNGKGLVNKLEPALKWCYENNIKLVNLSLGTIHFLNKDLIRKVINEYSNKGLIIIAASSNEGYTSYPSSLSNVIGVCEGAELERGGILENIRGIDFKALSDHELSVEGIKFKIGKSNSYAAPYITAAAAQILYKDSSLDICGVKKKLYGLCSDSNDIYKLSFTLDWITRAYILDFQKSGSADFYFSYMDNLEGKEKGCPIDTVIFKDLDNLETVKKYRKNAVYIGSEKINRNEFPKFFWSREILMDQIINVPRREQEINVPVILVEMDKNCDMFFILKKLKKFFNDDGYNLYTACNEIEGLLYGIEYMPEEFLQGKTYEKLKDFLFWKIYFDKCDVIAAGVNDRENNIAADADMIITFNEDKSVKIFCDDKVKKESVYEGSKEDIIHNLYCDILSFFSEDENE